MGICFGCFGGGDKHMSKEEERLASEEARAKAAEAAQKRFFSKFPLLFLRIFYLLDHSIHAKSKKDTKFTYSGFSFQYPNGYLEALWSHTGIDLLLSL